MHNLATRTVYDIKFKGASMLATDYLILTFPTHNGQQATFGEKLGIQEFDPRGSTLNIDCLLYDETNPTWSTPTCFIEAASS